MTTEQQSEILKSLGVYTIADLEHMDLPPLKWAVPNVFAEGLTVFAGKQKIGKSFMLANIALAIAKGGYALGNIKVEQGSVLYLALEDVKRSLKPRIKKMLDGAEWPKNLYVQHDWRKGEEGIADLEKFVEAVPDTRAIFIDVARLFLPPTRPNADGMEEAYRVLTPLKKLAAEHHIAVVLVMHMKKGGALDPHDEVYGSVGYVAAADTVVTMTRERVATTGAAKLYGMGRECGQFEHNLLFDESLYTWKIGAAPKPEDSIPDGRKQIVELVKSNTRMTRKELLGKLPLTEGALDQQLLACLDAGELAKEGKGVYVLGRMFQRVEEESYGEGAVSDEEMYEEILARSGN